MSPVVALSHRFSMTLLWQTDISLLSRSRSHSSAQLANCLRAAASYSSSSSSSVKPLLSHRKKNRGAGGDGQLNQQHLMYSSLEALSLPGLLRTGWSGSPISACVGPRRRQQQKPPRCMSMSTSTSTSMADHQLLGMGDANRKEQEQQERHRVSSRLTPLKVGGFSIEGISIGGHETCVMIPSMKMAFDIGRCPQRAISQDCLFISHAHMDHIGGVAMYVATRGLYSMRPPVVIVPACIKPTVEKLIEVYRELDGSELALRLVGLDIGDEYDLRKGYIVKPFRTYHVVPSQGYVVYSIKKKLKPEFLHLSGPEIKDLKLSGVEIVNTTMVPEVAFTGDTTADFITDESNRDALRAKLLIMEATFVDDTVTVEHARHYGHVHLSEVATLADRFENGNVLLIHFSARYEAEVILKAIHNLPARLKDRVAALLEGF